ncbi:hypothetical protein AU196_01705 [Mycobacterium sp. IS-1742]|uniref:hypothetical protein n=1 Tax=Mycobacterium sp. IS-1742 TaxID=1772285 RepID=UPI00073FDCAD|nr:hypothetical protein [Mycobacterium sp. IS-1742]KUI27269.1 hypothetical protein AU196_01705 [Mycobacterium sp. IS-1742]
MRVLRGLLGALLWILAGVIGLVGFVLCLTAILLPIGVPLLGLARRLLTHAVQLMMPRGVAHPVKELTKTTDKTTRNARKTLRGERKRLSRLVSK